MGIRDKLQRAKFTAEGGARIAKDKLERSAEGVRGRAGDVDAKRVARKAGRLTQRVADSAEAGGGARQPRGSRDPVEAAGQTAQMGAPVEASLEPLSGPEETSMIAGGAPRRGQPLDQLAVGGGGRRRSRDDAPAPAPVVGATGLDQMAVTGGAMGQQQQSRPEEQSSDPLVVDSPLMMGGDDGQR